MIFFIIILYIIYLFMISLLDSFFSKSSPSLQNSSAIHVKSKSHKKPHSTTSFNNLKNKSVHVVSHSINTS